jgi:hypothetical protein
MAGLWGCPNDAPGQEKPMSPEELKPADEPKPANEPPRAHAEPTKDFFINMLTRDITLADCILDLLDNSLDGAKRESKANNTSLKDFYVDIAVGEAGFEIADNCGGISLADAIDYAFHFGRRPTAPKSHAGLIGLYGIGMKRAIFKMARNGRVESQHANDSFAVVIAVEKWATNEKDWDFEIESINPEEKKGTKIVLTDLYPAVAAAFADNSFINELIMTVARDYAFVIQDGFRIRVNNIVPPQYQYSVKQSASLSPGVMEYQDGDVRARLVAGIIQELDDEIPDELRPDKTDRFGWYIVCNDRVIVSGDKTNLTVWGDQDFKVWHSQYNGFGGFLFLWSDDSEKLPWTTTKREVEVGDPLYLRARVRMKQLTEQFIEYTNARKADLPVAKAAEKAAPSVDVRAVAAGESLVFPEIAGKPAGGPDTSTISYRKPKVDVKEVAEALGDFAMPPKEVGIKTFEYFRRVELGK